MRMRESNIFDWLDGIRARPAMYIRNLSLESLEDKIWGYYVALGMHGISEAVPDMTWHFSDWLRFRKKWSLSLGWANAIESNNPTPEKALTAFFKLVDEYRRLTPTVLCTVRVGPRHNPTGRRIVRGMDGRIDKPLRVDLVRYCPAPLHFLRFHYPGRVEDQNLLYTAYGRFKTTVGHAKRWVEDELQIKKNEWEMCNFAPRAKRTTTRR